jgi:chemotaxis protein CheX
MNAGPISAQDLSEVTEQVWESFINADGDPEAARLRPIGRPGRPGGISAVVTVAGAWHGAIVVSCSPAAARQLAGVLLGLPEGQVSTNDVDDALGELANIIGGNIKGLLPGPSTLSLPYLAALPGDTVPWPAGGAFSQLAVDWYDEPVLVTVLTDGSGGGRGGRVAA